MLQCIGFASRGERGGEREREEEGRKKRKSEEERELEACR